MPERDLRVWFWHAVRVGLYAKLYQSFRP